MHGLERATAFPLADRDRPRAIAESEIAALRAHPAFAAACRQAALGAIQLYRGNRLFNALITDRGRSAVGFLALYLHHDGDPQSPGTGLTLSRLKALCADQDVGSPGRIEAFVVLMRMFGLLQQMPTPIDRRVRILLPTERLAATLRERWLGLLTAMAPVLPEASRIAAAFSKPAFEAAMIRRLGRQFLAGLRPLSDERARALFGDRNAGLMVAFSLMTAGGADAFPARGPVTVSISGLARQFGVSRVHVRKLLRDAADAGYIAWAGDDDQRIVVLEPLRTAVETFFANAILAMCDSAQGAFEEIKTAKAS